MEKNLNNFLQYKAYCMRKNCLRMTTAAGSGHVTSALSAADIVAALFFYAMRYDPATPDSLNNDRFILSKGHAAPILYAAWKEVGVIDEKTLLTYRQFNSVLEGHPTTRFAHTEAATGSLGMGLSIGLGMALAGIMDARKFHTYVLLGDSEMSEGSVWEAIEMASFYKTSHLIGIIDCNRLGQSTQTMDGYHTERYAAKCAAFGWQTIIIDGHDMEQIVAALDKARAHTEKQPVMIIAKTIKGYGVESVENKEGFHGKAFSEEELKTIMPLFEKRFSAIAQFKPASYSFTQKLPEPDSSSAPATTSPATIPTYKKGDLVATRKAYGQALAALGSSDTTIISLDAEVKNSTFAELFEQAHPERFVQCFIAEQNMVSMGVGFARMHKKPFISTFAAFFTRAHDQLRMAAIGKSSLNLVGSHAGVSIGQDGPSQMGLEDIALMRTLPDSIVLYPSDATSTAALVKIMAQQKNRICYLRTTREATPVIYQPNAHFSIGGCSIVKASPKDQICVIAAGITLHEAKKAHVELAKEEIPICVIDLYSIKPMDKKTIKEQIERCHNVAITVEDHYLEGGLGQAVAYAMRNESFTIECLAVRELPRSGKPEELLAWAGIDAASIVKAVKKLI
jgi:transketolase